MPRAAKHSDKPRQTPLHVQLDEDQLVQKYGRISQPGKRRKSARTDQPEGDTILDPKTSRRIFELAKNQQEELELSDPEEDKLPQHRPSFADPQQRRGASEDDDEDIEEDDDDEFNVDQDAEEVFEIDEQDLQTLDALLPKSSGERKTLADIIFSKIGEDEQSHVNVIDKSQRDNDKPDPAVGLDPKVVEVYTKVGQFLAKYKSGPLPKIFKVIPSLPAWARMLALTHPENWTPHACRAATKIFISNMKPPQAQLFLEVVLLDAIREDIQQNKKLNPQFYEALKIALFKPAAVFKGLIFPLLDNGCTLKEAAIIASVLARKKIPVLHSSAALMRIAEMDYTGPNSLFIRVLVDKKHQLPYKVVDSLIFHFIRLSNTYKAKSAGDTQKLPVLWHQSLLAFCQRYANDLTPDQKDALLDVIRVNPHPQIGPDVRRELANSVERGAPVEDGDVVMG
ncbi:Bystin-domain-containing protein [Pterulicium gracile]|uniref:Bystin-domain-containing protein n=1 Tax=Pterulicium gracile TaxID=1884261 RepID=A0A5C3QJH3_9AGAR|nr:Bystin-domain-containing protein [Pterula gracilis]